MRDIENIIHRHDEKISEHDIMINKHSIEITELKDMSKHHHARIEMLENLMKENQKLLVSNAELQNKLVEISSHLTKSQVSIISSQNRMMWKMAGIFGAIITIIGGMIAYLHI